MVDKKYSFYYIYINLNKISDIHVINFGFFFRKTNQLVGSYNFNTLFNKVSVDYDNFDSKKIKIKRKILKFFKKNLLYVININKKIKFLKIFNLYRTITSVFTYIICH
jgi:hypothetical protein